MPPSPLHESMVKALREHLDVLVGLGVLPEGAGEVQLADANLTGAEPVELRADLALVIRKPRKLGLIVEVQLKRSGRKRFVWPHYASALAARHNCPAGLVVVTPYEKVARWAAGPIPFGLDCGEFRPKVVGPDRLPVVTDPEQALAAPGLWLLSLAAHVHGRDGPAVLAALGPLFESLPADRRLDYHDFVLDNLPARTWPALEEALEKAMPYKYTSEFARKHYGEGRNVGRQEGLEEGLEKGLEKGLAEGETRLVLRLLARRLGMPSAEQQARVRALPLDALEALGEALLDFAAPGDLDVWLAAHSTTDI